jgi:hypothetical protein
MSDPIEGISVKPTSAAHGAGSQRAYRLPGRKIASMGCSNSLAIANANERLGS